MTPVARLLQKHRSLWAGTSIALDPAPEDVALFDTARFTNARQRFAVQPIPEETPIGDDTYDVAVLYLPKGTRRQRFMMHQAAALAPRVVVVGAKNEGIKPARKRLAELGKVVAVEHGSHRQMIVARVEPTAVNLDDWEERIEYDGLTVVGLPGVFSRGRVDAGTMLLLQHLEVDGDVLDVGCGAGVIGAQLAQRGCTVTLSDVDALAVEAARRTLAANLLSGTCVHTDRYRGIERDFDVIVSNPPFHQGVGTEYDTTIDLIREAPTRLREGGSLWLVYNRFLPWQQQLESTFKDIETIADDGRYCVIRAR